MSPVKGVFQHLGKFTSSLTMRNMRGGRAAVWPTSSDSCSVSASV